jgi:hypothetical protein
MTVTVRVSENYHYGDDDGAYKHGDFSDRGSAIKACQRIVDEFLESTYKEGMTAEALYEAYKMFGDDPWIEGGGFSGWSYAKRRCKEICADANDDASTSD